MHLAPNYVRNRGVDQLKGIARVAASLARQRVLWQELQVVKNVWVCGCVGVGEVG